MKTETELKAQVSNAIQILRAIAETIRELKEVPSGTLYAQLMGQMDLATYQRVIDTLKGAKVIEETPASLLRWIA